MSGIRKKILIVTYIFPPYAAVGVYRILKFCKFLIKNDFQPIIFTPENPRTLAKDEELFNQIPSEVKVYRQKLNDIFHRKPLRAGDNAKTAESGQSSGKSGRKRFSIIKKIRKIIERFFSIPDRGYFWVKSGLKEGTAIANNENVDFILSSSPPQSVHILASLIARKTGRGHIVDFRDLWTQNTSYHERKLPAYLYHRDRRMEMLVLENAFGISVNTASFKRQLLENNDYLDENRIEVVTNGIDPDDFKDFAPRRKRNKRFTMLYTGSLYGRHRNPEFFFKAIRRWINHNYEIEKLIRVKFIGNWTAEYTGLIAEYELDQIIEKTDWLPQRIALEETFAADLLLLFQGFDLALEAAIPRKLYEYMVTGRPILAFAPPGEIPDLIQKYDCGISLSAPTSEPIIDYLDKRLHYWRSQNDSEENITLRAMPELETSVQVEKLIRLMTLPKTGGDI